MKSEPSKVVYESEGDVVAAINDLIKVVDRDSATRKFFSKTVHDLEGLKSRIGNHDTRIAIVGITSSGKSTLMNAVLGAALLPTRVGPSSSRQVLCGWGREQMAEIRFDPETQKPARLLTGNAAKISSEIEKYGDERFNPKNRESVDEIRVHAPKFRFNHDLVIIDTPGLDAYGLDQHKEVTMKLVLPTVDMVLFLTNVKCDSDATNLAFLDAVTTDDKPLVIVQNKIDSLEPKVTRDGVSKTVEEIKVEHRHRLERLRASAKKASVRSAPIVQVSAKAKNWTQSNLGELGRVLDKQIRANAQFRLSRRVSQLGTIVKEMLDALRPKLEESAQTAESAKNAEKALALQQDAVKELESLRGSVDETLRSHRTDVKDCVEKLLLEIERQYGQNDGMFSSILQYGQNDGVPWFLRSLVNDNRPSTCTGGKREYKKKVERLSDGVNQLKLKFEEAMKALNRDFSTSISETQAKTRECCRALNLEEAQIVRSEPFHEALVKINEKREKKEEPYREKKAGFFSGLMRFLTFGTCGYEEGCRTKYYVNIADFVNQIEKAYVSFSSVISGQVSTYRRNSDFALKVFNEELAARHEALEVQSRSEIPLQAGKELEKILQRYEMAAFDETEQFVQNVKSKPSSKMPQARSYQETLLPPEVFYAAKFAHESSFLPLYAFVDAIVRRSGCDHAVVCGWDPEKLQSFCEWFVRDKDAFEVIDFSKPVAKLPPADGVTFLLVNAEQAGSFRGKLFGSGVPATFIAETVRKGKVVWVMDSVREHVSANARGDAFADAFCEMKGLIGDALRGQSIFDVMACDRELYWSVLLHELTLNRVLSESENARQEFVKDISDLFRLSLERRHATGRYVTQCTSQIHK